MKKITAALFLFLFILTSLPAQAKNDDELKIGITQFPSTFHPNIDSMLAKTYVLSMTRRPFTVYDPDWKLVCMLCTGLPTLENGKAVRERTDKGEKGIAVTYSIQPNATWGDGQPVTVKDVQFTWEVGRHPLSGVSNAELYRRIWKVTAIDEKTFTLHFNKVTFDYNTINDFLLLPDHIERKIFEADPKAYKNRTAFDTDTTREGLFFGPYLITKVERGSHIVLERNPNWWGKKPFFRRIVLKVIPNTAALEANLLSGGIHMVAGELGLTTDQALAFEKRHGRKFNMVYKPGLVYEHLDLNLSNPILADKNLRKALIYGIDRDAISRRLFAGRQPVAHSMVAPNDVLYDPTLPQYAFNGEKADLLLRKAGWTVMKRGIRYNKNGEKLSLELMTTAGNRSRELVQQVLQSQWKALGIDVRIKNEPARVFFGQTVTERKYSGLAMFAWISSPENVPRSTLHSAHIPTAANNWAGQNYTGFRNEEVDRLIDEIEVELDPEKRKPLWRRLQEIYVEELPVIPLYFRSNPYILPKWLKGVVPTGHQGPTTLWVENWDRQ